MKIIQIAVYGLPASGVPSGEESRQEWIFALCDNGRVAAKDITSSVHGSPWVALPEIPENLFG